MKGSEDQGFLPDFCAIRSVFAVVIMGELLVFVLVLARTGGWSWEALSLLSLYVQWIGLVSAAVLCLLRRRLLGLGARRGALASYALVLIVAALAAAIAQWLLPPAVLPAGGGSAFLARTFAITAIVAAVALRYLYLQHQWRARMQAAAEARIDALQARIRPHFLFNSLNTIASAIGVDPRLAERLVEDLADLFRASLTRDERRLVPLAEELALVDGYLRMEHQRLGERLDVAWRLDGLPRGALIPPLTLQPLLENAVYYGIEPREEGGTITLTGGVSGDQLLVEVRNPAPSMPRRRSAGFGMAQANVRERLLLAFGERARLEVSTADGVYHVTVRVPYRRGPVDEDTHR
ncbi:sensor histidine kinase [Spiribacter halobius]|nr:sensor histidine kinase [Spiribacter halobius]UEX78074.1 sensor histidine kinase [Spiribacter halobius]